MVLLPGMGITLGKESPLLRSGVFPGDALQLDPRLLDLAPFLFDALALVAAQRGQIIIEIAIARILPMELHILAQHHALRLRLQRIGFIKKQTCLLYTSPSPRD